MRSDCTKSLLEKKHFQRTNSKTRFCCLYVKLATVQIWRPTNKFLLSFTSLKCLLQVKKIEFRKTVLKIRQFIFFQTSWYSLIASCTSFNLIYGFRYLQFEPWTLSLTGCVTSPLNRLDARNLWRYKVTLTPIHALFGKLHLLYKITCNWPLGNPRIKPKN